ncbi:class I adenylate-forming enzyme family protein [Desertimonas flava]|uniref:class I adenylate-forming enzyme family protein n=1 Tax=Desertimonas flava TaxID=2064846 RepID=UPI000E34C995|nr:AMP-binding protein [Desertimonas flava]
MAAPTFVGPGDWIRINASRIPQQPCLVDAGSRRTLTFAEVNDRVERLATALRRRCAPGDRVAILATDGHRYVETILACMKAEIVYVPLNFRLAPAELELLVERSDARLLFVSDRYSAVGGHLLNAVAGLESLIEFDVDQGETSYEGLVRSHEPTGIEFTGDPETVISLSFTSGTTGRPKGVQQSYRMIANMTKSVIIDQGLRADEFRYASSPLFHVAGAVFIFTGIALGYPSLLLPQFDIDALVDVLVEERALTGMFLVPTMISSLLDHPRAAEIDFGALRSVLYGAAPITPELLRRALDRFDCQVIQSFGAGTEAGGQSVLTHADHQLALTTRPELLGSIGRPGFGVELRLCDEQLNDVPRGEVGEIVTRSETVMSGYLDMPEESAAAMVDGWFRAGDLAWMDETGYLFLAGRRSDMIIRGGENVYPSEIEATLAEHADVRSVAVVGAPDEHWGEVVHAYVIPHDGVVIDPVALGQFCAERLASYKRPVAYHVVDEFPLNASGKVLKRLLDPSLARLDLRQR